MIIEILSALCLVLVIEGILPFLSPDRYRRMLSEVSAMSDSTLRGFGAAAMIGGALLLYFLRG
ncbi:MAG: hypothetical protein DHS20C11_31650 [Lysobacteraceae bacterium]|nr:MAG: hypothetical protein DHS20C11_31650 [Xanthomonadaceae bacterium]